MRLTAGQFNDQNASQRSGTPLGTGMTLALVVACMISANPNLNPSRITPSRDLNAAAVMQTAMIGDAEVLGTTDQEFLDPPAEPFLPKARIEIVGEVVGDIALTQHFPTSRLFASELCIALGPGEPP